jgi:hypothetical protein
MSSTGSVNINYIFANYEKKVVLTASLTSTGGDLKRQLLENWPEGTLFMIHLHLCMYLEMLSVYI